MPVDQGERLKELIARFVLKYNYWGYLFSRIRRQPLKNFGSIMGVAPVKDGTITLLYEPDLMAGTDDKNILTVIEHEGMHILNKHIPRFLRLLANETSEERKMKKTKVWNIASDCTVNTQAGITNPIHINGHDWPPCLPQSYGLEPNKITEEYFYTLLEKMNKQQQDGDSGKGSGSGKDGEGFGSGQFQQSCGDGGFDDHKRWKEYVKGVSDISSLSRKIDQHVQSIIKESVKHFSKDRGNIPSHIANLIEGALAPPKAPYYQIIRKLVRGSRFSKFLRSPTKINRKRTYVFTLKDDKCIPQIYPFPGKTRDLTFDIVVLIDTSGSMSNDDILEGLSGIKNIIENDRYCFTTVLEVDAGVEKEYEVKKVRDIQFNVKGRGGTTLTPGLERARQLGCDVCLAFTDGYTENINALSRKRLPKRLIWVITKGGTADNVNRTGYVVKI